MSAWIAGEAGPPPGRKPDSAADQAAADDDGSGDLFPHAKACVEGTCFDALSESQRVQYERDYDNKGPRAVKVKLVE